MKTLVALDQPLLTSWYAKSDRAFLVEFYANWCIYHLLTIKKLAALQKELSGLTQAGSFDVTHHEEFVKSLGVTQVPSIVYVHGDNQCIWVGDTDLEKMLSDIAKTSSLGASA